MRAREMDENFPHCQCAKTSEKEEKKRNKQINKKKNEKGRKKKLFSTVRGDKYSGGNC